ncbi:glycosyltransferase [Achromobacter sp. GG226]|uniref:glycosyltransferase n=1 Tax=Verticiella alkaliphila TaxID=2779529 RepID=UPI001C0DA6B6|nr:glycosyltransferase [Verticiella sp. GG226]MBU4613020.1 glycosyltransferase [Verticiella sp. GG226]
MPSIHQFHRSCTVGDGVTKSLFYTRRLLRELGFDSEIYCQEIPPELRDEVRPLTELPGGADYLLLQHHSLGYREGGWLDGLAAPRVLVYHNITPVHLLPGDELPALSRLGREQLAQWAAQCVGAIGMSDYNTAELLQAGYRNAVTLPLLVDLDIAREHDWDRPTAEQMRTQLNILFVGRINENKRQHELIEVFEEFLHVVDQPARLVLVGGVTSEGYRDQLRAKAGAHLQAGRIVLTDKVGEAELQAYYRTASLFVCLSEHEGFCMPILEAMQHDVPVIARDAGALAATMGEGGLVLDAEEKDARAMASLWHTVLTEPGLRRRIIAGQRRNLARYEPVLLRQGLADYLASLGQAPRMPAALAEAPAAPPYWQVEGPIDSYYSLAIVNRHLGLALDARGVNVGLNRATGTGGGTPDDTWLRMREPAAARLEAKATECAATGVAPDVSLRFHYPPWVDGMRGLARVTHSYGWEESAFPQPYVDAFNRGLDLVTTLSTQVSKILRDSGVRVPMAVVGTGVDHILAHAPRPLDLPEAARASFRFLHVSSCFPRKGIDVLLEAWGRAFRAGDDVVLIIKTFPNPHNDVADQLKRWRARDAGYPAVVLVDEDVPPDQLLWLYQQCHAFVAPSRGEGFGMPMAEAMLLGLPVIVTAWGGQTDFCTPETAWLCDYDFVFAQSHLSAAQSVWAEPRAEHLAELLRDVRQATPEALQPRLRAARDKVERDYSWRAVAERTQAAVERTLQAPTWRRQPRVGWVTTWNTRCGIASYSGFQRGAIPDDRLVVFAARSDRPVAPDEEFVVRNWREDMSCLQLDEVEAALQARSIDALVIQYNFGFFSVQALGDLVRRAREAGIPSYVVLHSTADVNRGEVRASLRTAVADLARAERLIVHGLEDLNRLKSFGLVDNVQLLPHGVPAAPPEPSPAWREARGLTGRRVIAMYGFLLPHKGAQVLVQAFARLARTEPDLHLALITALYPNPVSDAEKAACEALIAEHGLQDRVTFVTDFLSDADSLSWLQMADLIVYPYQETQESSSAAVRGGLAAGRAVAVTPLSIFADVDDAVHRLPGTSVEDIALGIWALMSDAKLLQAVAARGRAWCDARRWPLIAQRLHDIIDGVANDIRPG